MHHLLYLRRSDPATRLAPCGGTGLGLYPRPDPRTAHRRHRRYARHLRQCPLQLRGSFRSGTYSRRGPQDIYSQLLGILRGPLLHVGRRDRPGHDPDVRPGYRFRPQHAFQHRRREVRRGNLRGYVGSGRPVAASGSGRRPDTFQPLGIARSAGQAQLPAHAGQIAIGPDPVGLHLLFGRLRRIFDRPGIRRQRPDRRERPDAAAHRTVFDRGTVDRRGHRHRKAPQLAPPYHDFRAAPSRRAHHRRNSPAGKPRERHPRPGVQFPSFRAANARRDGRIGS